MPGWFVWLLPGFLLDAGSLRCMSPLVPDGDGHCQEIQSVVGCGIHVYPSHRGYLTRTRAPEREDATDKSQLHSNRCSGGLRVPFEVWTTGCVEWIFGCSVRPARDVLLF